VSAASLAPGTFNFMESVFSPEVAERHYLEYHVPQARQLPDLRRDTIGRLVETRTIPAERHRGAILAFDSVEAPPTARPSASRSAPTSSGSSRIRAPS